MAFIDKLTTMRRFAIIGNPLPPQEANGNIEYEGVWIEGTFLIKKVGGYGVNVSVVEQKDFDSWLERAQDALVGFDMLRWPLILVWLDNPRTDKEIEVRARLGKHDKNVYQGQDNRDGAQ